MPDTVILEVQCRKRISAKSGPARNLQAGNPSLAVEGYKLTATREWFKSLLPPFH